jgi:hypothetical protein
MSLVDIKEDDLISINNINDLSKNNTFEPLLILIYHLYNVFVNYNLYDFNLSYHNIVLKEFNEEKEVTIQIDNKEMIIRTKLLPEIENILKIKNNSHSPTLESKENINILVKDIRKVLNMFGRGDSFLKKIKQLTDRNIILNDVIKFFPLENDCDLEKIKHFIITIHSLIWNVNRRK